MNIEISRLPSEDGLEWINIRLEGMDQPTTVIRQPGEDFESLIERVRLQWEVSSNG